MTAADAGDQADEEIGGDCAGSGGGNGVCAEFEKGFAAFEEDVDGGGDDARESDGDDRSRAEFEQEQCDGEENRGDGRVKRSGDAGGSAGGEEGFHARRR